MPSSFRVPEACVSQTAETTETAATISPATPPELTAEQQAFYGGLLLVVGLIQIPAARFAGPRLLEEERWPGRSFLWTDLGAVVLAFVFGQAAVAGFIHWRNPGLENLSDLGTSEALALTAVGFLLPCVYIFFAAAARPNGLAALGLRQATPGFRLTFSAVRYFTGLPMFLGLALLSGALMNRLGEPGAEQEVAVMIRDALGDTPWTIVIFAVIVVPLLEEILFRGFLLELITGTFGRAAGVLVSSAAFAVAHGAAAALPIFGLAIILSLVKLRTRSLGACWFVHALHNGGTTFMLWLSTLFPVT